MTGSPPALSAGFSIFHMTEPFNQTPEIAEGTREWAKYWQEIADHLGLTIGATMTAPVVIFNESQGTVLAKTRSAVPGTMPAGGGIGIEIGTTLHPYKLQPFRVVDPGTLSGVSGSMKYRYGVS